MRCFFALLLATAFVTPASALDPESRVPYQLKVVMRLGDHPEFTDHFRLSLKRDLLGSLQAALGNLGTVEVVDLNSLAPEKWEPIWKTVNEKGLAALDKMNEVTGTKTHFLRIDFADGRYELQARQYDGATGFVTPIIRKMQTFDRGFVARLAGLMIGQDFGIMATFDGVNSNKATLRFKAAGLGPLNKWVKKGDVFAILQICNDLKAGSRPAKNAKASAAPPKRTAKRADNVLMQLQGEPRDGICQCRMISRYADLPAPRGVTGLIGYRVVKLGTITAPLKLQLLDHGVPVKGGLHVRVGHDDFPDAINHQETVNHDGIFTSKESFANVAFVRVVLGDRFIARIPIEILDDRVDVRKISLTLGAELQARLNLVRAEILSRIRDGRIIQVRCFQDIAALTRQRGKNQVAFERGESTMKILDAIAGEVQDDVQRLQAQIETAQIKKELPVGALSIKDCQQQLQTLRGKQNELRDVLDALQIAIKEENDPNIQAKKKKVDEILRRAELLRGQAEFDKALKTYEEALTEVKDEPGVRRGLIEKKYETLKKDWELRDGDAQHAETHKWIYEVWPTLGKFRDLRDLLPTARKYFEKCKSVGDRLTIIKMQLAGLEVYNRFTAEFEMASKNESIEEEDKKGVEAMLKVKNALEQLIKEAEDFVRPAIPKAQPK